MYYVALPRFTVLLDLAIKGTAVLESVLPDFEVIYGSQLDCRRQPFRIEICHVARFLSVSSSCGRFVEAQYGAQSCAEAFRGALSKEDLEKMRTFRGEHASKGYMVRIISV